MDYEQKYKEALKRAKKLKHDVETIGCSMAPDTIEIIFPELEESEDEKIRKELWDYFHDLQLRSDADFSPSFTIDDILAYLEKQKEQKPAEWSEEDEDFLKRAIWYVENPAPSVVKDTNLTLWLKSLRPQPHWKPSEEQIIALARATNRCVGVDDAKILIKLLEQLESL